MKPDRDYIHALMIEKITGSISEPERQFIDNLIENDPQVKKVYDKLCSRFTPGDLETRFQRLRSDEQWKDITAAREEKQRYRVIVIRRVTWAAALIIGVFAGGYYFLVEKNRHKTPQESLAKATLNKVIQLQLANGQTIDLSVSTGQVTVGAATLKNAGKALSYTTEEADASAAAENTLRVPVGVDYKVTLSDGTEVWLNSATTLRFPFKFTREAREITLDGEAFLKVAQNADKPFIVHTPNSTIQVLGTEFNINTYDSGMVRVALVQGAVQVKAEKKAVTIKRGEEAIYSTQQKKITVGKFDVDEVLSWREGIHYFHNASLEEIVEVFPRWYGVAIVIDNKQLSNNRFTGILNRNDPLESFLNTLKATTAVNAYYFDKAGMLHLR